MVICVTDSDNGDVNYDYDHELSLEMKRQKIQRELMKLEQENMDKREEIVIKKEVGVQGSCLFVILQWENLENIMDEFIVFNTVRLSELNIYKN